MPQCPGSGNETECPSPLACSPPVNGLGVGRTGVIPKGSRVAKETHPTDGVRFSGTALETSATGVRNVMSSDEDGFSQGDVVS